MKCEAEHCDTKANGYVACGKPATFINRWGHYHCEECRGPHDQLIGSPGAAEGERMRSLLAGDSEEIPEPQAEPAETRCQRCGGDLAHSGVHCEPCVQEMTD